MIDIYEYSVCPTEQVNLVKSRKHVRERSCKIVKLGYTSLIIDAKHGLLVFVRTTSARYQQGGSYVYPQSMF